VNAELLYFCTKISAYPVLMEVHEIVMSAVLEMIMEEKYWIEFADSM
jgi:hypothetical protein